jgi:hypothetical protein
MSAQINVTEGAGKVTNRERLAWGLEEFAAATDTSVSFIRLEIRRGKIRPARLGRRVVILDREAQRYLAAGLQVAAR